MKLEVDKPEVTDLVVVYSGRFQPFHAGHYVSYLKLAKKFGKDNVYIATSNSTSGPKSPFDFKEKKEIATKMFNVPSDKFIQVSNPYAPKEILQSFDGKTTAYIAAVGEKDESRLSGKYFKPYKGKTGYGYDEIGYTYAVPAESNPISGTDVRNWLGSGDDESKKKGFLKAYPKFNADIFKMITNKLNEDGFPGGIGTGLNLPGGYINGAPTGSANESNNTEPSSALRPEPKPTRHQIEHPSDEPDWYKNESLYDPIGHIIDRFVAEEVFNEFTKKYFNEAPNPIMDKEFDYTAADGSKKKIKVKSALRLAKDHPAHVQASKMVGTDKSSTMAKGPADAPANEPKKLPQQGKAATQSAKPSEPGQPVKQGQTQQGKVDATKGQSTTSPSQGAEPEVSQTLSGDELKSSAEKKNDGNNNGIFAKWGDKFKEEIKEIGNTINTFLDDDEVEAANEGHDPNSKIRKNWTETATDFIAKMPANIANYALKVAKQKVHQVKNTVRGVKSLALSTMNGGKPEFGWFKDRDGTWKQSESERVRQKKAFWATGKDIAITAAAVVLTGAFTAGKSAYLAGKGVSGAGGEVVKGAASTFGEGALGFLHHMAVDFGKHCFKESVFMAAGSGHKQAGNLALGAGLVGENLYEENDTNQNASAFTELLKQTLEKMQTFEPNPKQYLEMLKSYAETKQKNSLNKIVGSMNEAVSPSKRENVNHFVEYATKRLNLKETPKITLVEDPEFSRQNHSLGGYNVDSKEIFVATEGRLTADILRTIAHEMVHRKQDEMGLIGDSVKDGATGSEVENKANSIAAILLREYGKLNKTIYNEVITIDVDKGDTVLMGKFKNKRTTVKDIGTDDHGMPTINGKKAATFRIPRGEEEKPNPQSVFNEVGSNDWRFKAIMKMWDNASSFGKKKIGAAVCKDPNADRNDIAKELRNFGYRDITDVGDDLGLKEVTTNDWHFKAIMKLYDKSNSFGKKKIGVAVCNDPNASRRDIVVQLRDTDYEEVTDITDKLRLSEYIEKKKLNEKLTQSNLDSVERYADRELEPADIEFSNHFFDRVNDTRNGKEISEPELTGFFKRLTRHKKQFLDFLEKYNQIVVKDDRSNINIPFVKMANKVIAKTVMRKGNFQTTSPTIVNEETPSEIIKDLDKVRNDLIKKVDVLIAKKKKLYSNVDIESPMSADEKQLDKDIQSIFSQIQQIILKKRSLKESLNEGLKWESEVFDKCLHGEVPLSLNIVKKLVDPIVAKSLHITDIDNLSKVAALEGTKKSISTFNKTTKTGKIAQGKGLWTKGGVIVSMTGTVLAQSIHDLWTYPDKQGRRWIEPGAMFGNPNRERDQVYNFAPELKPYKEKYQKEYFDGTTSNAEKAEFIKKYFEAAEKFMLSKKKEFVDRYSNANTLYYESDWNEVVLTNIKIEKILVIPSLVKTKTQIGSWTFDRDDAEDTEKQINQVKQKYKNVEVAKNEADIENFINNNGGQVINESVNKSVISEGGAYGHMSHPFDDMDLTFGDLKNIITGALTGNLELTREKTDGQALAISWKNGRLIAARNKGHLANAGANAMGIEDVASKFGGRGGLTDAYNFAMRDLTAAISGLSEPQRKKIFDEGKCFMNLEVIWPTSVNVIPYGQPLLVFHNTTCYGENGVAVGSNQGAATMLAGMIKQVNADVQSKYTIQGPPVTQLPKNEELGSKQTKYLTQLQKLQFEFQLSNKDGVAEYHQAWWANFIDKSKVKLQKLERDALINRWAFGDKSFRLNTITDKDAQKWAIDNDKVNVAKQQKDNIRPFEEIFLGVGADVLSFMDSVLTANPNAAVASMKQRLKDTADKVRGSGDITKIAKLKQELARLQSIGGLEKIVPNEGIVFIYKGNTYKLTGTFAPLNQILGIFY
jgi:hypothetical protein